MSKSLLALVLVDVIAHGLKAGQILDADPALIKQLEKDGSVDSNREAVLYAKSQSAQIVRSAISVQTERRDAAVNALRVEIAQLEDLHAKAEGDTKAALAAQVAVKQNDLTALQD